MACSYNHDVGFLGHVPSCHFVSVLPRCIIRSSQRSCSDRRLSMVKPKHVIRPYRMTWLHIEAMIELSCSSTQITRRSKEHTFELQSLMRISYAVFCSRQKIKHQTYCSKHTPTRLT